MEKLGLGLGLIALVASVLLAIIFLPPGWTVFIAVTLIVSAIIYFMSSKS